MGRDNRIGLLWALFALLATLMSAGSRVAAAGACNLSGSPYRLTSDTVDWSMKIDREQNCSSDFQLNTILSSSPGNVAIDSVKLISSPQSGQVVINNTGFLYVAKADFQGRDTFTLAVHGVINGTRGSSTVHIFVSRIGGNHTISSATGHPIQGIAAAGIPHASAVSTGASSLRAQSPSSEGTWSTLKIGAGGDLTGLDVAPDGVMVVRTDTYGAYLWNGSQWQPLITSSSMPASFLVPGLNAHGVYELQIAPSNSNVMYMVYDGYVLTSSNRGTTWTQTSFSQVAENSPFGPAGSPAAFKAWGPKLAIDPSNARIAYVGTGQSGLFATTDGGSTWASVSGIPAATGDRSGNCGSTCFPGYVVLFDPANVSTVIAQSYGNGIYESTNATSGASSTWTRINNASGPTTIFYATFSKTGDAFYCLDAGNDLWQYANGTWTEMLTPNLAPYTKVYAVAVDPKNSHHVIAEGYNGAHGDGLLNESTNGGSSWGGWSCKSVFSRGDIAWQAVLGGVYANAIFFDQSVSNKLYVNGQNDFWNTTFMTGITSSTTITWNSQGDGIEQLVANQIIVPTSGHPLVASWDRAVFAPTPGGGYPSTFYVANVGVYAGWSIDIAPGTSDVVLLSDGQYAGFREASAYSTAGGLPFTSITAPSNATSSGGGGSIAASTTSNVIFAPGGETPSYSTNFGTSPTWTLINIPGISSWPGNGFFDNNRIVTADQVIPNTFYIFHDGSGHGVYKTTNGGANWTQVYISREQPFSYSTGGNEIMQAVPGEAGNLFYSSGTSAQPNTLWYRSTNGGAAWSPVANVGGVSAFGFGAVPGGDYTYPTIYMVGWLDTTTSNGRLSGNTFTATVATGFNFTIGDPIIVENSSFSNELIGVVTSYNSSTGVLVENVTRTTGSTGSSNWTVNVYGIWRSFDDASTWTQIGPWPGGDMDGVRAIWGDPADAHRVYVGFAGSGYKYGEFNYLLNRDLNPASDDNSPVGLDRAA
jgi:hypothetical protein